MRALWTLCALAALCACEARITTEPPRLHGVQPAQGEDESTVALEVLGERFSVEVRVDFQKRNRSYVDDAYQVTLVPAEGTLPEVPLTQVVRETEERLTAQVPTGLARGFYSVKVVDPFGREVVLPEAYQVVRAAKYREGFRIDPLGPQRAKVPFTVQVTAIDATGETVDGFTGSVQVTDETGTVTPAQMGPFSLGRARALLTVEAFASANTLHVDDGQGRTGDSNAFPVLPGLAVALEFLSASPSLAVGACSPAPLELEVRDSFGQATPLEAAIPVALTAVPPRMRFFADAGCTQEIDTVEVAAQAARAQFFVRGESVGTLQLRASPEALPTASLAATVTP